MQSVELCAKILSSFTKIFFAFRGNFANIFICRASLIVCTCCRLMLVDAINTMKNGTNDAGYLEIFIKST